MMNQETIDLVVARITGSVSNLKTKAKNLLVNAINELYLMFPLGDSNQILVPKGDNSNTYKFINPLEVGNFVTTAPELADAKTRFVNQSTVFSTWKRVSYGTNSGGAGNPVPSNLLPGTPSETTSWTYNTGTDRINSTLNSSSVIGFISDSKYDTYTHKLTVGASGGDNDYILSFICFTEDYTDMVPNNALGQSLVGVDTTSPTIPNQHTISVICGRTIQPDFPFHDSTRYAIVYDFGKLTEQILVNGEDMPGLFQTSDSFGSGQECDLEIVRNGDDITVRRSQWSDASGGKGSLGFALSYNLTTLAITTKFRGACAYGYGALSQQDAYFNNISISPSRNNIFDLPSGDVWVANTAGVYSKDTTRSYYTEFGVRRFLYNPFTTKLIFVNADKTLSIVTSGADLSTIIGLPLTRLTTTDKSSIIAAINDVDARVAANYISINQKINSASANFVQTII